VACTLDVPLARLSVSGVARCSRLVWQEGFTRLADPGFGRVMSEKFAAWEYRAQMKNARGKLRAFSIRCISQ
jgi:hypothetical protein